MKFRKIEKIILTIPAWLNTFAEANHVNFSKVLQETLLDLYKRQNTCK